LLLHAALPVSPQPCIRQLLLIGLVCGGRNAGNANTMKTGPEI
jgi:hypothetical protein